MSIVTEALEQLIQQAEREGKWLWCHYQDLWFSPAELRKANAEGRFRWGVVNWKLRDPSEHQAELDLEIAATQAERERFNERIQNASND